MIENILFVNVYERRGLICTVFPAFELLNQNTLSLAATMKHRGSRIELPSESLKKKHVWLGKTLISFDNINVLVDSKSLLTGLSKPSMCVVYFVLCLIVKHNDKISARGQL